MFILLFFVRLVIFMCQITNAYTPVDMILKVGCAILLRAISIHLFTFLLSFPGRLGAYALPCHIISFCMECMCVACFLLADGQKVHTLEGDERWRVIAKRGYGQRKECPPMAKNYAMTAIRRSLEVDQHLRCAQPPRPS